MSIPKPRNPGSWRDPRAEPSWCVGGHDGGRHRSAPVVVGRREDGGQVSAWLVESSGKPTRVGLNVAHLAGLSVEVPVVVAAEFVAKLITLLNLTLEH